jgi:hypothetical protein
MVSVCFEGASFREAFERMIAWGRLDEINCDVLLYRRGEAYGVRAYLADSRRLLDKADPRIGPDIPEACGA